MNIQLLTLEDREKWEEIVTSFPNYDVYYLPGYVSAFKIHGDGEPYLIFIESENVKAINVVMRRDITTDPFFTSLIPANTYFDFATPYGYGGFIFAGEVTPENIDKVYEIYQGYCQENGVISEFVRYNPLSLNAERNNGFYDAVELSSTVNIDLTSKEQIWENFTSKNRNGIRKAMKSGVEIYWGRSRLLFDAFLPMYHQTMNKDQASEYYYFETDFFYSLLLDLKNHAHIFYAEMDGKIISIAIVIYANQNLHYHLSASDPAYNQYSPSNLLLYEVAKWGSDNGYKNFHLGGGVGSSEEDSLFKFKKAFNRNYDTSFTIGKKIYDPQLYQELVKLKSQKITIKNPNYFPLFRAH